MAVGRFKFSERSAAALESCHHELQLVATHALAAEVIDFAVDEGHRGEAAQNAAFATGKSQLPWPKGKHNAVPSNAMDLRPIVPAGVNVWSAAALPYWYFLAGVVLAEASAAGVPIRWGGDWDSDRNLTEERFRDLGHFERVTK